MFLFPSGMKRKVILSLGYNSSKTTEIYTHLSTKKYNRYKVHLIHYRILTKFVVGVILSHKPNNCILYLYYFMAEEERRHNTGLAKVAVQCSADTLAVNQSLVLIFVRIQILFFDTETTAYQNHII